MKVGSKGRYAVVALADVALHDHRGSVPLADVAERQGISLSYLEQLFAMLRRAGLVISARGPGGGYRLSRTASAISIGEIFRAVEEAGNGFDREDRISKGSASGLWTALEDHIQSFLDQKTLEDAIGGAMDVERAASVS
jgi:Rrf2 family iron-sulfur cluster assembly transcriptional regulator